MKSSARLSRGFRCAFVAAMVSSEFSSCRDVVALECRSKQQTTSNKSENKKMTFHKATQKCARGRQQYGVEACGGDEKSDINFDFVCHLGIC